MQQVKIFKSLESNVTELEGEVNAWIRRSGANILSITGNIAPQSSALGSTAGGLGQGAYAPSDVVIIILYETPAA